MQWEEKIVPETEWDKDKQENVPTGKEQKVWVKGFYSGVQCSIFVEITQTIEEPTEDWPFPPKFFVSMTHKYLGTVNTFEEAEKLVIEALKIYQEQLTEQLEKVTTALK